MIVIVCYEKTFKTHIKFFDYYFLVRILFKLFGNNARRFKELLETIIIVITITK